MKDPTVNTPRPEWFHDEELRKLPTLLAIEGVAGLKKSGGTLSQDSHGRLRREEPNAWIWPNPGEDQFIESGGRKSRTNYQDRLRRAEEPNLWLHTLRSVAGLPYISPVELHGASEALRSRQGLADGARSLTLFARNRALWKFIHGISFAMVDLPSSLSTAFPYLVPYSASSLIDWSWSSRTGRVRLDQCRLRRFEAAPDQGTSNLNSASTLDPKKWPMPGHILRVRHYIAGDLSAPRSAEERKAHVAIYRQDDPKDPGSMIRERDYQPILTLRRDSVLMEDIPLVPFCMEWDDLFRARPKFLDSARLMAKLMRKSSEYDVAARDASRIFHVFTGIQSSEQLIRVGSAIGIPENERAFLLEPTGQALKLLGEDLRKLKEDIATTNLEPLSRESGQMSISEVGLRQQRPASELVNSARSDSASLTTLARYWETMSGIESPRAEVRVIEPPMLDNTALGHLIEMAGGRRPLITPHALLETIKKRTSILPDSVDPRKEAEAVLEIWGWGRSGGLRPDEELIAVEPQEGLGPEE